MGPINWTSDNNGSVVWEPSFDYSAKVNFTKGDPTMQPYVQFVGQARESSRTRT